MVIFLHFFTLAASLNMLKMEDFGENTKPIALLLVKNAHFGMLLHVSCQFEYVENGRFLVKNGHIFFHLFMIAFSLEM